jgi:hypothetical protein
MGIYPFSVDAAGHPVSLRVEWLFIFLERIPVLWNSLFHFEE